MIRHILTIIWSQRRQNGWIALELFIVTVVMWVIVDTFITVGKIFFSPQGFDIEHTYTVNLGIAEEEDEAVVETEESKQPLGALLLTIMDRIRTCLGVEAVGLGYSSLPFDGNNRYTSMSVKDSLRVRSVKYETITPGFMEVFRFRLSGNDSRDWREFTADNHIIVSDELQKQIVKMGGKLQDGITFGSDHNIDERVIIDAVIEPFRAERFTKNALWLFDLQSDNTIATSNNADFHLVIRITPEADIDFPTFFQQQMNTQLDIDPFYLIDLTSMKDIRDSRELKTGDRNAFLSQLAIMCFLLLNIFLGIIGTFWFRTQQRKGEMGLRISLGSSRIGLRNLMITEGLLLLALTSVPAFVICLNIQFAELTNGYYMDYTAARLLIGFGITGLLIACIVVMGIWYPSRQVSRMQPAEALHYE